jgi:molybdopterin-guanine dinucleotide biosynthesis protein A
MSTCSGALLCGGKSSRMGRDKALLEVNGQPLWRLQWTKLQAVCGEVRVCGRASQGTLFDAEQVPFESDATAGLGPLSGIARALQTARGSHVLVLAVDMPRMSERYLLRLCQTAGTARGVVPQRAGVFEALCAIYPLEILPAVLERLAGPERSLQPLIRWAVDKGLLHPVPIADSELGLFENWNAPGDLAHEDKPPAL